MGSLEFKKVDLNIMGVLNSNYAMGEYRGKETCEEIRRQLNIISDYTLILIDLRGVVMHTAFCEPAFGPIFEDFIDKKWGSKYVIFKMLEVQKLAFFQGVLKHFKHDIPRKTSEEEFVSHRMSTKLIIEDNEAIDFIGDFSGQEHIVLDAVNNLKNATTTQIVNATGALVKDVVYALDSLAGKYFIIEYKEPEEDHVYYSFYNYLRKE
ncbi:MAG: hypothetical protein ABSA46_05570 [Thermodesulfovibrionales bacterium]|jgi:hypothetical protein